ncbi:MAG: hypothetical protein WCQ90_05200 [Deltaproteobacteria bacterium]
MSRKSRLSFLEEEVGLLVQYFGADRVQTALSKVSNGTDETPEHQPRRQPAERDRKAKQSVMSMLERIRQVDEEKHRLLADFYTKLKDKKVLPESQDIRHFAQVIGIKEIAGKSRKDMIPKLMRFLVEQPTERLQVDIETAPNISEQQRQQGFSVLTDKLLGDKEGKKGTS